jgi:hypothetical protein
VYAVDLVCIARYRTRGDAVFRIRHLIYAIECANIQNRRNRRNDVVDEAHSVSCRVLPAGPPRPRVARNVKNFGNVVLVRDAAVN